MSSLSLFTFILANLLLVQHLLVLSKHVQISTVQGKLKGEALRSRNGTEYFAFYNIPYAKPPVDKLRFEAPQKPDAWDDVRDATKESEGCVQFKWRVGVIGKEDCLYLNVFTPYESVTNTTTRLATIVFVHGGGMVYGKPSDNDPKYFMDHRLVYVNFQYRLNGFGFISAGDDVLPGNYGMKDQVAVLKWVQEHIDQFGGDSNRVTLMGNSSGGANVHLHMHSPLSQGLFQQVITQSGSGLARWAVLPTKKVQENTGKFAKMCGCVVEPTTVLVECLRKISANDLLLAHEKFKKEFASKKPFAVVLESKSNKNAFLIENPWLQNTISQVPWLTGITSGEGTYKAKKLILDPVQLEEFDINYKQYWPTIFNYEYLNDQMASETSEQLRKFYFNDKRIASEPQKLVDIYGDTYFSFDCMEAAKRHLGTVYFFLYDHRNEQNFNDKFKSCIGLDDGLTHADELISLFKQVQFNELTKGPDFKVSERIVKYWVNFVQTGDPNGAEKIWLPIQSDEFEFLHIETETDVMEKNLWAKRYNFWRTLPMFEKYNISSTFNEMQIQKEVHVPRDIVAPG